MTTSMPARRASAVAALGIVAALALTSCSGASSTSSADTDLTWATVSAPQSLDNTKAISAVSYTVQAAALETLLHVNGDGELEPWLAESWTTSDDKTFVFTLRDDVTFWNGDPLTAEDVAYSLTRLAQDSSLTSYNFVSFEQATATGDNEVTVTLSAVDPLFLPVAVASNGFIVQQAFAEEAGDALGDPEVLTMGTGPYQVESFSKTGDTVLARYDDYWGDAPSADSVTFTTITDPETMRIALTQGQVDGTFDARLADAERYSSENAVTTTLAPGLSMEYLSLDVREAPFDDIHLRKAIAYAVSKDDLVTAQLKGNGQPADVVMTRPQLEAMFGEDGTELTDQIETYDNDIDAAKEELAQSAYPDGLTIDATFAEYDSVVFQVLQADLAEIGITLNGSSVTAEQFYDETSQIDQPQGLRLIYTGYGSLDPWESLRGLFAEANTAGYSSAVGTENLATLASTLDEDERKAAVVAISQDLAENVPYIPLYTEQKLLVLGNDWTYEDFAPRGADWIHRIAADQ
ncbi:ABC transporter substrate-binding protein [Microbacterium sp. 22179]|uniref:ABC transporter substrate-binding protein n=1 Tax=Microbacterium sp. 22179 TaxID=3453886 RepID=UPI003F84D87A